jgi:predicted lipoprotein with Yx(FWY)xxD motif
MIRWLLPVAMIAAIGSGAAMAATSATHSTTPVVKTVHSAKFGAVLVNARGRTLYRYTLDSKGVNRCTGDATCAKYWPQLLVKAGAKPTGGAGIQASLLSTIKAKNGMRQVTYAGFPLYTFAGDTKAGQVNGEAFEKQWYVVNTKGAFVKHTVASGGSSSPSPTPSPDPGYGTTTTSGSAWG